MPWNTLVRIFLNRPTAAASMLRLWQICFLRTLLLARLTAFHCSPDPTFARLHDSLISRHSETIRAGGSITRGGKRLKAMMDGVRLGDGNDGADGDSG